MGILVPLYFVVLIILNNPDKEVLLPLTATVDPGPDPLQWRSSENSMQMYILGNVGECDTVLVDLGTGFYAEKVETKNYTWYQAS